MSADIMAIYEKPWQKAVGYKIEQWTNAGTHTQNEPHRSRPAIKEESRASECCFCARPKNMTRRRKSGHKLRKKRDEKENEIVCTKLRSEHMAKKWVFRSVFGWTVLRFLFFFSVLISLFCCFWCRVVIFRRFQLLLLWRGSFERTNARFLSHFLSRSILLETKEWKIVSILRLMRSY